MLGIVRNKDHRGRPFIYWRHALRVLPEDFVESISFGHLTLDHFKIIKWRISWSCCLIYFGHHLVVALSFGYFFTDWTERYWNAGNH